MPRLLVSGGDIGELKPLQQVSFLAQSPPDTKLQARWVLDAQRETSLSAKNGTDSARVCCLREPRNYDTPSARLGSGGVRRNLCYHTFPIGGLVGDPRHRLW